MTKQAIIDEIELRTSSKYSSWRIGLTNNPDQRRGECGDDGERTDFWMDFEADSPADAKEIETGHRRGIAAAQGRVRFSFLNFSEG
jgi:hypothetical protein